MNLYEDKTESAFHSPQEEKTLVDIRIPSGQTLVLTHFANEVDDSAAWGATDGAEWNIIADGSPVRSYTNIRDQYGAFNQPREIPFGFVTARQQLIITSKNNQAAGGSTFKLGVSIKGAYLENV